MKISNLRCFMLLPMLALCVPLLNAHASDGVIHFRGSIVEAPCTFSQREQSVKLSCTQDGKPVVRTVAFNQLNNYKPDNNVPLTTQIHYLDPKRKLAVLEVTYR